MCKGNLMDSEQDYIDNMGLEEATEYLKHYLAEYKLIDNLNSVDEKAFEIILNTLKLILKIKETILSKNIVLIDDLIELFDLKENTKVEIPRKEFNIEDV